jgi:hypothetical protein
LECIQNIIALMGKTMNSEQVKRLPESPRRGFLPCPFLPENPKTREPSQLEVDAAALLALDSSDTHPFLLEMSADFAHDDSEDEEYWPPAVSASDQESENTFDSSDEKFFNSDESDDEDDFADELAHILEDGREEICYVAAIHASQHAAKAKAIAKERAATTAAANAAAAAKAAAKAKAATTAAAKAKAATTAAANAAANASSNAAANKTRCACRTITLIKCRKLKRQRVLSSEITLTAHHYSLLRGHAAKLRTATLADRSEIFEEAADDIERNWAQGMEFDRKVVESVSLPSVLYNRAILTLS